MLVRRGFFYWQTAAAIVLPVWLLIGWGIWGTSAAGFIGVAFLAPVLVLALLVIVGLTLARKSVRETRAVSWLDVGILTVLHLSLIGLGFFGPSASWFAIVSVIAAIAAFWSAIWQLVTETRNRVRAVFDEIQRAAAPQGAQRPPIDAGEYIVIDPPSSSR
ncbi:hypothetical protein ACFSBZ_15500 [Amnibacterium flavum]|uniref:Uncharacterized protein n=1 Tax=Amnibacterium flavum TaxID=2173173 RepID=A0A2V1HXN6_9MICO|nr:hypothetical protein [Amnibacterium flavum]PVZ96119.1 hypothetical protein DDQ50_06690 [Amnibacterium flavum]